MCFYQLRFHVRQIKSQVLLSFDSVDICYRFDALVSADAFQNLKPAPDIFLAAAKALGVPTNEVWI